MSVSLRGWNGLASRAPAYAVAVGAVIVATLARLAMEPLWGLRNPYILFFPAVLLSAWYGGLRPGIVSTLLSAASAGYFWIEPARSWRVVQLPDIAGIAVFVGVGVVISLTNEAWHRQVERSTGLLERERAAHDDAETSRRQLEIALESGRLGTWEFDLITETVRWSPTLEGIHGYAPGTFPRTFDAFKAEILEEDRARVIATIGASAQGGGDHHVEYRIVRRDGSVRWVEGRGQVFHDAAGKPARMAGVCVDITDRRQAADMERETLRRAVEVNRMKDQFLATLSHELRTPINSIMGYAELLTLEPGQSERAPQYVDAILRNARSQARLIESLLDLARLQSGKMELQLREVDIADVVSRAVDVVRPAADAKGVDVRVSAAPGGIVLGDPDRLQQIVWNLLANAVKFTPSGGVVQVGVAQDEKFARVQLADSGRGISPEFLPRLFERFQQWQPAGVPSSGGLGIGLALVKELVEAHGGTVTATSPGEGQGSTFLVALPRLRAVDVSQLQSDYALAPPTSPLPALPNLTLPGAEEQQLPS
jgi:PAS domain S-box-containing protein